MPIVRLREITDMDSKERSKKLSELRAELSRLRTMISAGGAVENPARIRELRRAIARILTIENQQRNEQKKTEKQTKESKKAKTEKKEKLAEAKEEKEIDKKAARNPAKTKPKEKKKE